MRPAARLLPAAAVLAAALALAPGPLPAGDDGEHEAGADDRSGKVQLVLQATPRHGFQPLDVTFYARLENVAEEDDSYCHAGLEWIGETRSGRVMRSTEDARCLHPEDVKRVDHSFSKSVSIDRPAVYRYYMILHLKDGTLVRSNVVEVRVISSH